MLRNSTTSRAQSPPGRPSAVPFSKPAPIKREVTPLVYPSELDMETSSPAIAAGDSSLDSIESASPPDISLDDVWQKVRKLKEDSGVLAISPPKVKSLDVRPPEALPVDPPAQHAQHAQHAQPTPPAPPRSKNKRRRSIVQIKESSDGKTVTATFDVAGVKKDDMHINIRGGQLCLTWKVAKVKESVVDGVREREREVHHFHRMITLPTGTTFNEVQATKDHGLLSVTYPNSRVVKIE